MKSNFRSAVLNKINLLSAEERALKSNSLQNLLAKRLQSESGTWVGFKNLNSEPAIHWQGLTTKIEWAFPVVSGDKLNFVSPAEQWKKSELGVEEPMDGEMVDPQSIQGFVVPAVAYSRAGHRLGRGRGYFDKTIKNLKGKKIGVCYAEALFNEIPYEAHDLCCDEIITDTEVCVVTKNEGEQKWN